MESKLLTADRFVDVNTEVSYRYIYSETEYFRPHYHDYFELFLITEGNVIHIVNGAAIHLSKGDLVFIRPTDDHNYILKDRERFSMLNFTFTANTAKEMFKYLGDGFPTEHLIYTALPPETQLTRYDLERICKKMDSIQAIDPKNYAKLKTELRILLFDIFTRHFSESENTEQQMPAWLEIMFSTVKKNGNFALGTDYFFSLTDKSREHVSRSVKKYTGMTVSEYINTLRINYIANMLRNSKKNIADIIFDSGFNNISWASELFKNKYNMTMRQYRKGINKTNDR